MKSTILLIFGLLVISVVAKHEIIDCQSEDNIQCKCQRRSAKRIVLTNCTRIGGWSTWSEWSQCRSQRSSQKRRRRCDNPPPIGTHCKGEHVQSRKCDGGEVKLSPTTATSKQLPEFFWGSWSEWNEWGICSCPENQRRRIRHCIGWECSGCSFEIGECERRCAVGRWWGDWSEWSSGISKVRYRSWCSLGIDGKSLITSIVNETLIPTAVESAWSEWELRHGVAFRYRIPSNFPLNASIDIQHQLISYNSPTRVSLIFCVYLSIAAMITGFIAQSSVSWMFSSCRERKYRY